MTAEQLYAASGEFRAFMATWARERRCPFPLPDFLTELGLEKQAACARWCFEQPDRAVWIPLVNRGENPDPCGPYPAMTWSHARKTCNWFFRMHYNDDPPEYASNVPRRLVREVGYTLHREPVGALVELMDLWAGD